MMDWIVGTMCHRHFFPGVLIVLDVCAAASYGVRDDKGRVLYWLCAAGITFAATFGKMK